MAVSGTRRRGLVHAAGRLGVVLGVLWVGGLAPRAMGDGVPCDGRDFVGGFELPGHAIGIELVGDTAYVLDRGDGLHIFDVSKPSSPVEIGHYHDPASVDVYRHMHVEGTRVYLGYHARPGGEHRRVLDVSDPGAIAVLGTLEGEQFEGRYGVRDGVMFVQDFEELRAYDLADPAEPVLRGVYGPFSFATGFFVQDDRAYVIDPGNSAGPIRVLDLGDPTFSDPGSVELGRFEAWHPFDHIQVVGDLAYISRRVDGVRVYDIRDLDHVTEVGGYDPIGSASHFSVVGSTMYVTGLQSGLEIVDVSDPGQPELLGTSSTPGYTYESVVRGDLAYFASYDKGLQVISVAEPSTPLLGAYRLAEEGQYASPAELAFEDGLLYVGSYGRGLEILDVSVADAPVLAGSFRGDDDVIGVHADGGLVYLALASREREQSGVYILDVSDAASPRAIGFYGLDAVYEMGVRGDIVYAITQDQLLHIIDAADPSSPTLRSTLPVGQSCDSISFGGDVLYLADQVPGGGLVAVDISDLDSPSVLSTFDDMPGAWVFSAIACGDTVYVTKIESEDHDPDSGTGAPGGVYAVDCSDPSNPVLIGSYATVIYGRHPRVSGGVLSVADFLRGMLLFDVSDPSSMRQIGSFFSGVAARDVLIDGDVAYIAVDDGGGRICMVDVSDDCGTCAADLNGDRVLNFFDVSAFLGAFVAQSPVADFTRDGVYNFFDVSAFLQGFSAGCP